MNNTGCLAVVNFGECGHGAGMDASIRGVVFVLFVASSEIKLWGVSSPVMLFDCAFLLRRVG